MGSEGDRICDVETATLIEIGTAFVDLIEGRIDTDASDSTFVSENRRGGR